MENPLVGNQLEYRPQWRKRTKVRGGRIKTTYNVVNDWESTEAVEGYIEQGVTPAQVDAEIARERDDSGYTKWENGVPVRVSEGYWHDEQDFLAMVGQVFPLKTSQEIAAMRHTFVSSLEDDFDASEKYRRTKAFEQAKIAAIFKHYGPDAVNHLAFMASRPAEERKPIIIRAKGGKMGNLLVDTNGKAHTLKHLADWALIVFHETKPDEDFVASIREKFPNSKDGKRLCRRIEQIRLRDFRQRAQTGAVDKHADEAVDVGKIAHNPERYIKALCLAAPGMTTNHPWQDGWHTAEQDAPVVEHTHEEWKAISQADMARREKEWAIRDQRRAALVKAREAKRRLKIIRQRTAA
jgi:hypothetical protein